ncbi:N-acetylglucosamine-6-phosphate deacetylase [Microbacterium sp. gxy059]|uniref:N-acetylglucosamine-6-phosphate deacetylase n=1 Tax=Microbacterium sp. gxy059 TaxID=2957199 RepID=UPI003D99EC4A
MTVIHSARLVTESSIVPDSWVRFDADRIVARGTGDGWRAAGDGEVVDAGERLLAPGFIDLHGHGGGGAAFDDGEEAIERALATHRAHGTTRSVLSFVTAGIDDLAARLGSVRAVAGRDPLVLGAHLEGPFLDLDHKGAHDPGLLRDATPADVDALLAAADGSLVQITLAPEKPGALDAIRRFVDAGVRVAVGHTAADYDETLAAFDAGASILTHAFNAMDGIRHRAPGPIVAAMRTPQVTLEIINDGVHVHPDVVRMAFDAAPGRVALITDAMAAAGAPDGDYMLGPLAVRVADGIARLAEGDSIAGSTLTLDRALQQAVGACGIPLVDAIAALTVVPARALGREGELGSLAEGAAADALLLDDDLEVRGAWGAGRRIA